MLEDNRFLGGHLVGIGKRKANGEIVYQELEKPIHNRITSVGLDHLFMYAGPDKPDGPSDGNAFLAGTTGNQSLGSRSGALHWVAFGSGTDATNFTDTALGNKTSTYYSTRCTSSASGQKLNGTTWTSGAADFGKYSFRVSHESTAVSEDTTINEIGWFGGYSPNTATTDINSGATPVLFARVLLPSPIMLLSGEKLITTYQLDETNANATETTGTSFFGLLGVRIVSGEEVWEPLHYKQRLVRYASGGGWDCLISERYISTSGWESFYNQRFFPAFCTQNALNNEGFFSYTTDPTDTLPAINTSSMFTHSTAWSGGTMSSSLDTYYGAGSTNKYRDRIIVSDAFNPSMSGDPTGYKDICGIIINGMGYLFGYEENGAWVSQALRKYANKKITFTFRTRYTTTV